jgi:DNA-binding transcriptional MerR regulator
MSIRDMQSYARLIRQGKATLAECRDLLQRHRERLLQRTEELQQALRMMDSKIALYNRWIERDEARASPTPAPRRKSRA